MIPREPEETNPEKPEVKEETELEPEQDLVKALSEIKQKAEDYLDSWKRAQADFINYKRRTEQEVRQYTVNSQSTADSGRF
jgi:molecular chaperone GrpE